MALITINTTTPTTPDPAQGGSAVTGAAAAGHASTLTAQVGTGTATKTCHWTGFVAVGGVKISAILKVGWQQDGSLSDGGVVTSNQFTIEYSLNGGSSWNSLRNATQIQAPTSGTDQAALTVAQDLTQVQVRTAQIASASVGESASVTVTISDIRIEVTTQDPQVIAIM